MKIEKHKNYLKILLFVLILISLTYLVSAIGVSTSYWSTKPLEMTPGQTEDVELSLHNVDNKDVNVRVEIVEGGEIAKLTKESYTIPANGMEKAKIKVSISENMQIGAEYTVKLSIRQVKVETEGMVQLAAGIDSSFPVIVKAPTKEIQSEEEKPATVTNTIIAFILIIILIIGYFILKGKKETTPFSR